MNARDNTPLRTLIANRLSSGEDTAVGIANAIGKGDTPSIVVKELNAMRTDGQVECEQRGKKKDLKDEEVADLQHKINMQDAELFKQAGVVVDLRNQLGAERTARQALQEQIDELQREAMRGASLLSGDDRYTAAGYLVRAPKRPLRTFSRAESAQAAALAAARNGSGRGEVFALVPVGKAVRGAEWRPS